MLDKCETVTEGCARHLELLGFGSKYRKPILKWLFNATLLAHELRKITDARRMPQFIIDGVCEAEEIFRASEPMLAKAAANRKRSAIDADLNDERTDPDDTSEHDDDPLHSALTRRMYFSILPASSASSSV